MAFTAAELALVNQALSKIGATIISSVENGSSACENYIIADLHYDTTRDSLLRGFDWNFALARAKLAQISTLTINNEALPDDWVAGDTITGLSSYTTATILSVTSETVYELSYLSGDFTDAEKLTNAAVEQVYWQGIEVLYEDEYVLYYDSSDADEVQCSTGYPSVSSSTPAFEWDYQYLVPSDFSRLISVYEDDGYELADSRYIIEGSRILTNYDTCNIRYVKKVTGPDDFDDLFTEVLILALALKFLGPVGGTSTASLRNTLQREYSDARAIARTVCFSESNTSGYSSWNTARFGHKT